jgi:PTS system mannose-specific IIA component
VGVVLVGHGRTASELLAAARAIVGTEGLPDVVAVDAGCGETPELARRCCSAIDEVEQGAGVLVVVDVVGASPCRCVMGQAGQHEHVVLSGLSLAMLLKLASDPRSAGPAVLARALADSAARALTIDPGGPSS